MKLYKAKSLSGAQAEVRKLRKQVANLVAILNQSNHDMLLLANLASDKAEFYNPLQVMEAKNIRNRILANRTLG